MMDRIVRHGRRLPSRLVRARLSTLVRLGLLALLMAFTLGSHDCDAQRAPTIGCTNVPIRVEAGTCTQFQNPCADGLWSPAWKPDAFELQITDEQRDALDGAMVYPLKISAGDETTRSICVSAGARLIAPLDLPFTYARGDNYGKASIILTVAPLLTVEATASPSTLSVGDSSQLVAHVS